MQWLSLCLISLYALGAAAWRGQLRATLTLIFRRPRRGDPGAIATLPEHVAGEVRLGGAILLACLIPGWAPQMGCCHECRSAHLRGVVQLEFLLGPLYRCSCCWWA